MDVHRFQQFWRRFCEWFVTFHFRNWGQIDKILIFFRALSIVVLIHYGIIDELMYSSSSPEKSDILKFIHGSQYIAIEIVVIIYASGVAAFGISIEIYIIVPFAIANCVLVVRNCGGADESTNGIIWVVKMLFMFLAVELCCRNFRKLRRYEENFNSSARAMLKQALFFSITMLVVNAPGLKPLYRATNMNLPLQCTYETTVHCGVVDLYEPLFGYDDDFCFDDLSAYAAGREQLRIFRDFIMLNIVSYAVFNRNFLEIESGAKYLFIRVLLVFLFIAFATSALISFIDPLVFIRKCLLTYNIIECIIFVIILALMAFNIYRLRDRQPPRAEQRSNSDISLVGARIVIELTSPLPEQRSISNISHVEARIIVIEPAPPLPSEPEEIEIMDPSPTILPSN